MADDYRDTLNMACRALADHSGIAVRLADPVALDSPHIVLRCRLVNSPPDAPDSVVVKQLQQQTEPGQSNAEPRQRFLNEWVALRYLDGLRIEPAIAPAVLGGDLPASLIVISDLGEHPTLKDILNGQDAQAAHDGLLAFARALGRMQAASIGREEEFDRRRASVGGIQLLSDANSDMRDYLGLYHEWFQALDVTARPAFDEEVSALEERFLTPEPSLRSYLHMDAGPHNVLIDDQRAWLHDFEFGGFGHLLTDVVNPRMIWPSSWQVYRIPQNLIEDFERAWCDELVAVRPQLAEDAVFGRALADACAHWALSKSWSYWKQVIKPFLEEGQPFVDRWATQTSWDVTAIRQMVIGRMHVCVEMTGDHLPALSETLQRLLDALDQMWPLEGELPFFPAFAATRAEPGRIGADRGDPVR